VRLARWAAERDARAVTSALPRLAGGVAAVAFGLLFGFEGGGALGFALFGGRAGGRFRRFGSGMFGGLFFRGLFFQALVFGAACFAGAGR